MFWRHGRDERLTSLERKVDLLLAHAASNTDAQSVLIQAANVQLESHIAHPRFKRLAIFNMVLTALLVIGATVSVAKSRELHDTANDLENKTSELIQVRSDARAAGVQDTAAIDELIRQQTKLANEGKAQARTSDLVATSILSLFSAILGAEVGWVMTLVFDRTVGRPKSKQAVAEQV